MTFRNLDALRGIAALAVALFHSDFIHAVPGALRTNGELFVDFFFVLSGFVMMHAYGARIIAGLPARAYLAARLGRVLPVHLVLMLVWLAYAAVQMRVTGASGMAEYYNAQAWVRQLLLLNSYGFGDGAYWNYPSWSISAEVCAYVVFFVVLRLFGAQVWRVGAVSVAAYLALVALTDVTLRAHVDFGFLRCIGGFFLGVLIYRLLSLRSDWPTFGTRGEVCAVALVLAVLSLTPEVPVWIKLHELASYAIFGWGIVVFSSSTGRLAGMLQGRVPVYLGRVSYSVYMLHALVFEAAGWLWTMGGTAQVVEVISPTGIPKNSILTVWAMPVNAALLAVTVLLAGALYRRVEEPGRRITRAMAKRIEAGGQNGSGVTV